MHDFDLKINRYHTDSVKYDGAPGVFGTADILPMWVADMDFSPPHAVIQALRNRLEHPVLGYSLASERVYEALRIWMEQRHHWAIRASEIMLAPGVVPSLHAAVLAMTSPGDGVIIQPPIYPPFFNAVLHHERRLMENPLQLGADGCYEMDFDHLEACMQKGARLLLLCSPHNPTGRVWTDHELDQLLGLCQRYEVALFSDEIHADLILPGFRHHPAARQKAHQVTIVTAVAPSKTFNIPGLGLSALIFQDDERRKAFQKAFDLFQVSTTHPLSLAGFEAAYLHGDGWLTELLAYLEKGRQILAEGIASHSESIRLIKAEGTYLAWLDCRGLGMSDAALKNFMVNKAKLGLNPGPAFGEVGRGFMRMNLGTRHALIRQAVEQLETALSP